MADLSTTLGGRPLKKWLESRLVADVVASGGNKDHAEAVVREVLAEKSIWEWLTSLDWHGLVQMILEILALLK